MQGKDGNEYKNSMHTRIGKDRNKYKDMMDTRIR